MFCPRCGKQLPDGVAFCDGCGLQLAAPTPAQAPSRPAKPAGEALNLSEMPFLPLIFKGVAALLLTIMFILALVDAIRSESAYSFFDILCSGIFYAAVIWILSDLVHFGQRLYKLKKAERK